MEEEFKFIQLELERIKQNNAWLSELVAECKEENEKHYSAVDKCVKQAEEKCEKLADAYNKAIIIINDLVERVAALEANYDPTIIK